MYSSGYAQVSKYGQQAQKKVQYRSKGKSCGYYMQIIFFFSSLIQSLIIVSLVLFLVYGKTQDSPSTARIQDLEESFSRLSIENVALRQQRKNLTNLLNITLIEKTRNDWDLSNMRHLANMSANFIQHLDKQLHQCNLEMVMCQSKCYSAPCNPTRLASLDNCNCGLQMERLATRLELVESNFTQTTQRMRMEMDQIAKERDNLNLEAIRLRREKSAREKELQLFKDRCKEYFVESLSGVSNVTKAFLLKIESLFPSHLAFQLTCVKQRDYLEQIHTNCTSLSREVEDKFQRYLNNVGEQVSGIQSENSRLKAENWRLSEDYRWCSQNRTGLIQAHRQNLEKQQLKHDDEKERLLMEKKRLSGDKEILNISLKLKDKEIIHLTEQIKQLNLTCTAKTGIGAYPGGMSRTGLWNNANNRGSSTSSSSSSSLGLPSRTGSGSSVGSSGSAYNKPGSTGIGSSSYGSTGSSSSVSSSGSAYNKPGSTGVGSSSYGSTGSSSSGSAYNKPGSTGVGSSSYGSTGSSSSGSSYNKPGSTGVGSSSYGSTGSSSSVSSSGTGLNKPATGGRSTSTSGSSYGSTGSSQNHGSSGIGSNKQTSSAKSSSSVGSASKSGSFPWFGLGSSNTNSGQSKPGSGTTRGTSTGSSTGTGRTNGGSVSIAQHLQDLQRFINPPSPEEKQDLSRMLG